MDNDQEKGLYQPCILYTKEFFLKLRITKSTNKKKKSLGDKQLNSIFDTRA